MLSKTYKDALAVTVEAHSKSMSNHPETSPHSPTLPNSLLSIPQLHKVRPAEQNMPTQGT